MLLFDESFVLVCTYSALMFSATFRKRVERVARDILTDPLRVVQGDIGEVILNSSLDYSTIWEAEFWLGKNVNISKCLMLFTLIDVKAFGKFWLFASVARSSDLPIWESFKCYIHIFSLICGQIL